MKDTTTTVLGIDIAKNVFQLHGVNSEGKMSLKKRLSRNKFMEFVATLPPCLIKRGLFRRENGKRVQTTCLKPAVVMEQ